MMNPARPTLLNKSITGNTATLERSENRFQFTDKDVLVESGNVVES